MIIFLFLSLDIYIYITSNLQLVPLLLLIFQRKKRWINDDAMDEK